MNAFTRTNLAILIAVITLAVAPLALGLGQGKDEPFAGADAQAEAQISADHPDYRAWFHHLYEPPSGEVESALFALQAALGAGFIGYYFGAAGTRRRLVNANPRPTAGDAPDRAAGNAPDPAPAPASTG